MAIDFPDNPTLNDELTVGNRKWLYAGSNIWNSVPYTIEGPAGPAGPEGPEGPQGDPGIRSVTLGEAFSISSTEYRIRTNLDLNGPDDFKLLKVNNSVDATFLITPDSTYNYATGMQISLLRAGTGNLTIVPDTGVTISATPGLKLRDQWSIVTLIKDDANSWVVVGDLSE
jgi:hypothetical protein